MSYDIPLDDVYDVSFGPITRSALDYQRTIRIRTGKEGSAVFTVTLMSKLEYSLAMLAKPHVGEPAVDLRDPPCELCGVGGCDDNDGQYHWHETCRAKFIREYNNYLDADLIVAMTHSEINGQLVDDIGDHLAGRRDVDNVRII